MQLSEPYRTRPIRFLDLWTLGNWRMKAYGIVYGRGQPAEELVHAARRTAVERLETTAARTNHYGVGFVGIHQGKTGNFVFVDWWADENELHHHVYVSPLERATDLEYMTPTGLAACAWDLFLIGHERDAWVSNVLASGAPDLDGYLQARLDADA
ncbi:MAG: hypothetical protein WB783_13120 [Arenicellales bacterium]